MLGKFAARVFSRRFRIALGVLMLSATAVAMAFALAAAEQNDELKAGQDDIQKTLRASGFLMDVDVLIGIAGSQFQGSEAAPVAIVEFFDYQCPYCVMYADRTLPQVREKYVSTQKVRYVFRNFPREQFLPLSEKAATVSECAGEQERYWESHLRLFKNPQGLDALRLDLDRKKLEECLESGRAAQKVKNDLLEGQKLEVPGTPSFYFGYPDAKDPSKVRASKLLLGSQPFLVFKDIVDSLLESRDKAGDSPAH